MGDFVVSARKYRPVTFEDVIGQHHITETLQNAISRNMVAQAMLFCGPRGVGKTTCARILAHNINAIEGAMPKSGALSMNVFELDAASNNSVDDIRNLTQQVRVPPQSGKYKVYIIDEVHMLSQSAFNAFLKTLEEPPPYAVFVLATTEKHKVLPTILSRCQIFDFKRIALSDIVDHLQHIANKENIKTDKEVLYAIAQRADGALRDALSLYDTILAFSKNKTLNKTDAQAYLDLIGHEQFFALMTQLKNGQLGEAFCSLDKIINQGIDLQHFMDDFRRHIRHLLFVQDERTYTLMQMSEDTAQTFKQACTQYDKRFLIKMLETLHASSEELRMSNMPRLCVELALMKLQQLFEENVKKKF